MKKNHPFSFNNLNSLNWALVAPVLMVFMSCSPTQFSEVASNVQKAAEVPPVDPPVNPPAVVPQKTFKLSQGACQSDSSTQVLSCLKCDVPQVTVEPQLSVKAKALMDIMVLACGVSNSSDLNNFRPTKEMVLNKLNRGSQALYPETARTAVMEMTIQALKNSEDDSIRKKVFGGLWYQPPYSDAFETYFGLTVSEAKSTFCWNGDHATPSITNVTGLYSKQYMDCKYSESGLDSLNCKEIPAYVKAQDYRLQLQNVLSKSISQPYVAPAPQPAKTCSWEKFSGDDIFAAKQQIKVWKSKGKKIALAVVKGDGAGVCAEGDESVLKDGVTVEMGSYSCK